MASCRHFAESSNPVATLHSVFGMQTRYPTGKTGGNKRGVAARKNWKVKLKLYVLVSELLATRKDMNKMAAIRKVIADARLPIGFRNAFDWYNDMDARQQKYLRAWHGTKLHKLR